MNCLKYLLDLLTKGYNFRILYNGNHVIGVSELVLHDYNGVLREELLKGWQTNYLPIEESHDTDTLIELFGVTEPELKDVLTRYMEFVNA